MTHEKISWQNEFLEGLKYDQSSHNESLSLALENKNSKFVLVEPRSVVFPFIPNKTLSIEISRNYMLSKLIDNRGKQSPERTTENKNGIIMITRNDRNRTRIRNIDAIESLIREYNGEIVDSTQMSLKEKKEKFAHCKIMLAESSGCTNFNLFGDPKSQLIALTDPLGTHEDSFLLGGWPYHLARSNNINWVVGENSQGLVSSTLNCSSYSIDIIRHNLDKAINMLG